VLDAAGTKTTILPAFAVAFFATTFFAVIKRVVEVTLGVVTVLFRRTKPMN
jgi:hypothetical protein